MKKVFRRRQQRRHRRRHCWQKLAIMWRVWREPPIGSDLPIDEPHAYSKLYPTWSNHLINNLSDDCEADKDEGNEDKDEV